MVLQLKYSDLLNMFREAKNTCLVLDIDVSVAYDVKDQKFAILPTIFDDCDQYEIMILHSFDTGKISADFECANIIPFTLMRGGFQKFAQENNCTLNFEYDAVNPYYKGTVFSYKPKK